MAVYFCGNVSLMLLSWYPVKSIDDTRQFYEERYVSKYAQPRAYAYAICLKEDNFPIGYIKVDMEEHHDYDTVNAGRVQND